MALHTGSRHTFPSLDRVKVEFAPENQYAWYLDIQETKERKLEIEEA